MQIPHIASSMYPPELSGPLYPQGIPIFPETRLEALIREHQVRTVNIHECMMSHYKSQLMSQVVLSAALGHALLTSWVGVCDARGGLSEFVIYDTGIKSSCWWCLAQLITAVSCRETALVSIVLCGLVIVCWH